jgi:ribosomal protein S27AE
MSDAYLVVGLMVGFVAAGIAFLAWGTIRKNNWGVNFKRPVCPACGARAPVVRMPASLKQAMWGGWTCAKCGQEVDKWGRSVAGRRR